MSTDATIKISIIIPTYNRANFLPKAVRSALDQTLREIEVICISDGSTDNTMAVLKNLARKDSRLRILSQRNAGSGLARNYGLRKAKGEFVAFLDSDDWYASDHVLEKLYDAAIEQHVKICLGNYSAPQCRKQYPRIFKTKMRMSYRDYQKDGPYVCGIYDRHMILDNGIFFKPYRRYQDPPFFVSAMICAGQFYAIPNIIYVYNASIGREKINWDKEKIMGLLMGIYDIIVVSKEQYYIKLQKEIAIRIKDGGWHNLLLSNLHREWAEAKNIMEKINDNFLEDAIQQCGISNGEKPFDEILQKVYGNGLRSMQRGGQMKIVEKLNRAKQSIWRK